MVRVIRFIIAGAVGAFVGWLIVEPIDALTPSGDVEFISYSALLAMGAILGLSIGLALGLAEVLSGLPSKDAGRAVGMGAAVGAAGGVLGLAFGQAFYGPLARMGHSAVVAPFIGFILLLIGRSVGWALIGLFIGATQGIAFAAPKRMINGAIGGLLGGGVGGAAFEILNQMNKGGAVAFPVEMLRLIGFVAAGAGIGLFIGLFEELFKQAWVVVLRGRNEGRESILFRDVTVLGRDELADVPVFGDSSVAPRHAEIRLENNRYTLYDLGAPFGTSVNGNKVSSQQLRDGDLIELGSMRVAFHEKATASRAPRYIDKQPAQPAQIPISQHLCPYCGRMKDASGNCDCSVGTPQASPAPQASQNVPDPFGPRISPSQHLSAAVGQASLVGVSGPYSGQSFPLSPGGTEIGREASKNVPLSLDNTVSRNHARVAYESGQFVIYDEGSANGTFVNSTRVQRQVLKNGDIVQVGSTKFRFEE